MRKIFIAAILMFSFLTIQNSFAQVNNNLLQQQQAMPVLEPEVIVGDLDFTLATLENVTITGNEVDAFIAVKSKLQEVLQTAVDGGKEAKDKITIEMKLSTANNLIGFMRRANIKGGNAERYKRVYDAIVAAANNLNEQNK